MRVVHLDTGATWRGGQQQVYLLHRELVGRGIDSRVLARTGGDLLTRCRDEGLPAETLPGAHPWWPGVLRSVARWGRGADLLHAHDAHAAGLAALVRRWHPTVRFVCHRRVSYPLGRNPLSRWKYRQADAWVAVSVEVAETLSGAGVSGEQVAVIHSGLDIDALRFAAASVASERQRRELNIHAQQRVVGLCGAFSPQKGHRTLVAAACELLRERKDLVFVLVGEGALRTEVAERVHALGLDGSFRFTGYRTDAAALTRIFDVAVVPSIDGEGSSAALKEPMALGVPVVASDLAGNLEVLGGAGLVFPRGDAGALGTGIGRMLDEEDLRQQSIERGLREVERFRPESVAQATVELYRRVLE